jgi:hypothetical protein
MIVPAQFTGDQSTSKHSVSVSSAATAKQVYLNAKERLLNVNEWKKMCGPHSADFQLTDQNRQPVEGKAAIGYLMRIDLPGPSGYDWVVIEAIEDKDSPTGNSSYITMRVRPTDNGEHFYEDSATSTFVVERIGTRITATVYGRNEVPNLRRNKLRNLLITIATVLGFQKPQWKSFVVGLLK